MVKLTILYKQPADLASFDQGYVKNLALLEKMPSIRRRQACLVLGSPGGRSAYYRILELYFDDTEALDAGLRSSEGQIAGADLMGFAPDSEIIFSEVYED